MDFLLASSRGVGIEKMMGEAYLYYISSFIKSGATYDDIIDMAKRILPGYGGDPGEKHVYVLSGIPNVTRLVRQHKGHKECIYTDKPDDTIAHIIKNIKTCTDTIEKLGAKAIFCTIAPTNIALYNQSLLEKKDKNKGTTTLHHTHEYETMQTHITRIITEVNNYIRTHNTNRGLTTPMFHTAIIRRHGKAGRGYYKTHWKGFYDGLHATEGTVDKWSDSMMSAITKNRGIQKPKKQTKRKLQTMISDDEEPETSKREWKNERGDTSF